MLFIDVNSQFIPAGIDTRYLVVRLDPCAGSDQSCFVRGNDGLRTVAQSQFEQNPPNMSLNGRLAEAQSRGQLGVAQALSQQLEHFELAWSQRGQVMVYGDVRI